MTEIERAGYPTVTTNLTPDVLLQGAVISIEQEDKLIARMAGTLNKIQWTDMLSVRNSNHSQPYTSATIARFSDTNRSVVLLEGYRDIGTGSQTSVPVRVAQAAYSDSAGTAVDQTARNSAATAQTTANNAANAAASANTNANNRMPIAGGTFTGNVATINSNRSDNCIRNEQVLNSSWNAVSTNRIIYIRQ